MGDQSLEEWWSTSPHHMGLDKTCLIPHQQIMLRQEEKSTSLHTCEGLIPQQNENWRVGRSLWNLKVGIYGEEN